VVTVTPQDVADYAPGAPSVTQKQIDQSGDWAELQFRKAKVTPPPDNTTLEGRELVRGIAAHALAQLPQAGALALASNARRVVAMKDSDGSGVTFAEQKASDLVTAGGSLLSAAYRHLYAAGLPRAPFSPGAAR